MVKLRGSINSNHGPHSVLSPVLDQNKMQITLQFHIMFIKVRGGLWCLITLLQLICRDVLCLLYLNAEGDHVVCDCFNNNTILTFCQDKRWNTVPLISPLNPETTVGTFHWMEGMRWRAEFEHVRSKRTCSGILQVYVQFRIQFNMPYILQLNSWLWH